MIKEKSDEAYYANRCLWRYKLLRVADSENGNTIEAELNKHLSELLKEDIQVSGASRTDTGVHALCNLAVFDTNARMPGEKYPMPWTRDCRRISGYAVQRRRSPIFIRDTVTAGRPMSIISTMRSFPTRWNGCIPILRMCLLMWRRCGRRRCIWGGTWFRQLLQCREPGGDHSQNNLCAGCGKRRSWNYYPCDRKRLFI